MGQVAMIEPCPVLDTYVSNIGQIEILDCNVRFTLYVNRGSEKEIVARIIMPIDAVPSAIAYTVAALGGYWIGVPAVPRLFPRAH